ncbi:hypothetical protein HDU97_001084 [Phlyctochytrium planicorne]|nr:hypothetical protein HDU97_001084 [Phlyctochytrium planicorne]
MAEGTPTKLEDFRLMCKLGEGTFSEVLKVKHKKTGKIFAMKRFRKHFQSMEEIEGLREIQALKRLNPHPNIIDLEDVIFDPKHGILSLNFELMDCNLYELISKKHAPITESKAKVYMHQICKGLEYMHSKGIFHRDIKPENILIKETTIKLGDFGSCRGIHSKPPYTEYIATRWYRSPECLLCDGVYNFKMDVWGTGCVLYEMITRNPLFPGVNEVDQLHRIHGVLGTPGPKVLKALLGNRANHIKFQFPQKEGSGIRPLMPQVSNECVDLVIALLAYSPDDRITSREALRHPFFKDVQLVDIKASTEGFTTQSISNAKVVLGSNPKLGLSKGEDSSKSDANTENATVTHAYIKQPKLKQQVTLPPPLPTQQQSHANGSNAGAGVDASSNSSDSHNTNQENAPSSFLQKFKKEMDEKRAAEAALARARRSKRQWSNKDGQPPQNAGNGNAHHSNGSLSSARRRKEQKEAVASTSKPSCGVSAASKL